MTSKSVLKARRKLQEELQYIKENLPMSEAPIDDVQETFEDMTQSPEKAVARRVYKGSIEVDHDLFKLEVATMKKNISIDDDRPIYTGVEHCHFYHSYDSSGKKQYYSNPIAGHCHKVTVQTDKDGNLVAVCGPAIKRVGNKEIALKDDHNHDMTYLRSERVLVREVNAEAQRVASEMSRAMQGL